MVLSYSDITVFIMTAMFSIISFYTIIILKNSYACF